MTFSYGSNNVDYASMNNTYAYALQQGFAAVEKMFQGFSFSGTSIFTGSSSASGSQQYSATSGNYKISNAKEKGLDAQFLAKVKQIASRLNCDYKDLLGVMNSESGINSKAVNKNGGATGLIQFMPSTAKSLGTTTTALKNMSAYDQLDYVEKFLSKQISRAGKTGQKITAGDLYTMIYMPARMGREVVCSTADGKAYSYNKGLDTNHDGQITKTELGNRVISKRVDESIFA